MPTEKQNAWWVNGVAGGLASAGAKTALCPMQRLTVLRQLGGNADKSLTELIRQVAREDKNGLKGFWRGNGVSVLQRIPYAGIQLAIYDSIKFEVVNKAEQTGFVSSEVARGSGAAAQSFQASVKAVAGTIAATISGATCYPLEVMRTRLMSGDERYRRIIPTAKAIWNETGSPKNFYRGLSASLIQRIPDIAINYVVYESVKFNLMENYGFSLPVALMSGSASAAVIAVAFTFPLDTIKRRMAMAGQGQIKTNYRNPLHCGLTVIKEEGPRALYAGAGIEVMRCIPQVCLMWGGIEFFREVLGNFAERQNSMTSETDQSKIQPAAA